MLKEPENDEVQEEELSDFHLTARQKLHIWYVGGVFIGGLVLVPWVTRLLFPDVSVFAAWIGGILSAGAFVACFDSDRNFKWLRAFIAIGLAVVIASAFHHATGETIFVLGGFLGFIVYHILGSLFGMVGVTVLSRWSRKLQAQIAKASPGETIVIQPGVYPLHVLIDKSIVLRAEREVVLQGLLKEKVMIAIESEDPIEVALEGFWVEEGWVGVLVGGQARATLVNNTVTGNAIGVIIRNSACVSMTNNDISGNKGEGILLAGESDVTLTENQITENGGRGIALHTTSCFTNDAQATSAFCGSIMGENNTVRENEKGNFCPPYLGDPWPEGFLKEEEQEA